MKYAKKGEFNQKHASTVKSKFFNNENLYNYSSLHSMSKTLSFNNKFVESNYINYNLSNMKSRLFGILVVCIIFDVFLNSRSLACRIFHICLLLAGLLFCGVNTFDINKYFYAIWTANI